MAPPALLRQVLTLLTYRSLLHQSARLHRIHRTDPVLQDLRLLERGQTAARRGLVDGRLHRRCSSGDPTPNHDDPGDDFARWRDGAPAGSMTATYITNTQPDNQ